jgi:cell wall-associated NlpC family hydrolase
MPPMPLRALLLRSLRAACTVVVIATPALALSQAGPGARPSSFVDQAATTVATAADKVWLGTQDLAVYALGLIGVSYKWGGESPDTGLDCSGLVRHVFQQVTGVTLPRTSRELSRMGDAVARKDLAPGDLVFFNTRRFAFSHVGIYLGDNRFIHAPRRGRDVEVVELDNYWQKHFNGARRLAGVLPSLVPTLIGTAQAEPLALPEPATPAAADASPPAHGDPAGI